MQHANQSPSMRFKIFVIGLLIGGAILFQPLIIGTDTLSLIVSGFLGGFIVTIPFLLLGVFTSGLIEVLIRPDDIKRWIPQPLWARVIGGVLLGFLFPVGEWGIVPVTRRLFTKGLPVSMGIALLLTAPIMNPIVFASTIIVFGYGTVFIGRILIGVTVAIAMAVMITLFAQPEEVLDPQIISNQDSPQSTVNPLSFGSQIMRVLHLAIDELFRMLRYLIVACLLASMMQTLISQDSLLLLDSGHILSGLSLQIQAFFMSISATADSAYAMTYVDHVATGAILSFLSFGAMIDLKSALLFMMIFQRKVIVYLLILAFLMNLLAGVILNLLIVA